MRLRQSLVAVISLAGATIGCSGSTIKEVAPSTQLVFTVPTVAEPASRASDQAPAPAQAQTSTTQAAAPEFVPPFPDSIDLFSPPKITVPIVTKQPEPKPDPAAELIETLPVPPLRLLGFVDVDGLKVLLKVDGELRIVASGEAVSGIEVVAIETPAVTLRHGAEEFQMNLLEGQRSRSGDVRRSVQREPLTNVGGSTGSSDSPEGSRSPGAPSSSQPRPERSGGQFELPKLPELSAPAG